MSSNLTKEEIINRLKDFNKHAEELFALSFVEKLGGSGCSMKAEKGKAASCEFRGPDDEAIKAFVNDIRRFFQKGEDTLKIEKLQLIYQSSLIDTKEKEIYGNVMGKRFEYDNKHSGFNVNGKEIANKNILEVFLYGKYSHRSKGRKDIYDQWIKMPPFYVFAKNKFIEVLYAYLRFVNNIVYANNQIIGKLQKYEN